MDSNRIFHGSLPGAVRSVLLTLALFCSSGAVAQADDGEAQDDAGEDRIIVRGMTEKQAQRAVRDLSQEVTRQRRLGEQMPRFYSPVCVLVYGLERENALAIVSRMRDNAERVGLPVGGEGCEPNILVGFVEDSAAALDLLREDKPWLFESLREYEIERDLGEDRSAQAWHVVGESLASGRENQHELEMQLEVPIQSENTWTRFRPPTRAVLARGVLLLEFEAIVGLPSKQVADYASMRMFASVDDTQVGGDEPLSTILSLFREPELAPDELTAFDIAYLEALYSTGRNAGDGTLARAASRAYRRNVLED